MFGQQRTQSGPAGLSINTNSANSLPNTSASQAPQSGGLFGISKTNLFGSTNTSQASQSGGLFSTAPTNQAGGLFGSQTMGNQPQQAGTGLFGSSSTNAQPQQQAGGLFGQTNKQQSGGLFGTSSAQQSQPQLGGGLLFGSSTSQSQPQQGGALFGSLGQGQGQQQAQQSSSIFGGANNTSKPTSFGTSTNQTRPPFGSQPSNMASTQQPQRSMFSTSIGQYSQQQHSIPGVRVDLSGIRPTTRFNDLYEDVQKIVEGVDNFILTQMHLSEECEQAMPRIESAFSYIPSDVDFCSRKLEVMQQSLENDATAIDSAKKLVKSDAADARLSFKAIQNLRMPPQFHHTSLWNTPAALHNASLALPDEDTEDGASTDLVSYFAKQVDEMSRTLESYKRNIAEVEAYLKGVEASTVQQVQRAQFTRGRDGAERSADDQVRDLAAVLREFENGILGVAGKVGGVREQVQEVMLGEGGMGRSRRRGP